MGILAEALQNYLALLGWSPGDGKTEILSGAELIAQFSLEHVTRSPAVFDEEKLKWLNRHYMKASPLSRLARLSLPYLEQSGYLRNGKDIAPSVLGWLECMIDAVLKNLDTLSQLRKGAHQPEPPPISQVSQGSQQDVAGVVFEYDPRSWEHDPGLYESQFIEQKPVREVLAAFIPEVLAIPALTYEKFREVAQAVQKKTGHKGRELFHPIRVALTGKASGPELAKLIPVIEEGAKLSVGENTKRFFPHPIKSCAERLRDFQKAAGIQCDG